MNKYSNNKKQIFSISAMLKIVVAEIKNCITTDSHQTGNSITPVIFLLISTLLLSTKVYSAAGDSITTTAVISYDFGGVPTVTTAPTTFTEDRRINFVVTASNGGSSIPVISNMTNAVMQFVVTNTGNDTQDFLLTAVNTAPNPFGLPADNKNPLTMQVFVEGGTEPGNGYLLAQDTGIFIDELMPNESKTVYVLANMPVLVTDDVLAIALVAQVAEGGVVGAEGAAINADDNGRISPAGLFSNSGTAVPAGSPSVISDTLLMETVFNDPAGLDAEDVDSATPSSQDVSGNGQHSDAGAYQFKSPVNIVKTVTVIDTLGGSDPHPGATLRYQLEVTVVGTVAIDNLIISDPIPANTTYTDGSLSLNGAAQTDIDDSSVPGDFSKADNFPVKPITFIEVDLSEGNNVAIGSGVTNTIIFEVTID